MMTIYFLSWCIALNWSNQKHRNRCITSLNPLFSNSLSPKTYFKVCFILFYEYQCLPAVPKIIYIKRCTKKKKKTMYREKFVSFPPCSQSFQFPPWLKQSLLWSVSYASVWIYMQRQIPFFILSSLVKITVIWKWKEWASYSSQRFLAILKCTWVNICQPTT